MNDVIKVLLVDDHDLARAGLRRVLELDPNVTVIGEASDGQEGLVQVLSLSPDVILMDLRMPTLGGLDAARLLKKRGLECKVIILSFYDEYLAEAIEAGLDGYLMKDVKRDEVVSAIRRVHAGEIVFGASLFAEAGQTQRVLGKLRERAQQRPAPSGEYLPIEVVIQPPAPPAQVFSLLTRLLASEMGRMVDFALGPGAETRLWFSVANAERFRTALSELPEVSYVWDDGTIEQSGGPPTGAAESRSEPLLRVVLTSSSTPRNPHV